MALSLPGQDFLVTRLDVLANWVRANSLWPMPFATACCGIELMATGASRYDLARFGAEAMRFYERVLGGRLDRQRRYVLELEGDDRDRLGEAAHGVEVVVLPGDLDVGDLPGRRVSLG